MNDKLLTPKQAAERLGGVSLSLIYQLLEEKRISHYRLGGKGRRGRIMIHSADLDRFLSENRIDAR